MPVNRVFSAESPGLAVLEPRARSVKIDDQHLSGFDVHGANLLPGLFCFFLVGTSEGRSPLSKETNEDRYIAREVKIIGEKGNPGIFT